MEGGEDIQMFREIQSVDGGIRSGLNNGVRFIEMNYKFRNSLVAALHEFMSTVEGR